MILKEVEVLQTNADRIRAMTDEELCELVRFAYHPIDCSICAMDCYTCFFNDLCNGEYENELEWLKQPSAEYKRNEKLKTVLERNRRVYSEVFTEY